MSLTPSSVSVTAEVASDTQVSVMLREASAMTSLAHPNLLSVSISRRGGLRYPGVCDAAGGLRYDLSGSP